MKNYRADLYIRARGIENPYYKKDLHDTVVKLIEAGEPSPIVAKILHITRERVRQIYSKQTGKSINQVRREQKLEQALRGLPILIKQRIRICKGCGIAFKFQHKQVFHNSKCQKQYASLKYRPLYAKNRIKVLREKKKEIDEEIKRIKNNTY